MEWGNVYFIDFINFFIHFLFFVSNEYWEWGFYFLICFKLLIYIIIFVFCIGAEDDDLAMRLIGKDLCITRPNETFALYKMSNHEPSARNLIRNNLLFTSIIRMNSDGISNLEDLKISVVSFKSYALFVLLKIDLKSRSFEYFFKNLF